MSQNDQPGEGEQPGHNPQLQEALNAYGEQVLRECTTTNGAGQQVMTIPFAQLLCDIRVLEVKLAVVLKEIEREQLVDNDRIVARLIRELALETRRLKQVIDARPKVAIAHMPINGKGHG